MKNRIAEIISRKGFMPLTEEDFKEEKDIIFYDQQTFKEEHKYKVPINDEIIKQATKVIVNVEVYEKLRLYKHAEIVEEVKRQFPEDVNMLLGFITKHLEDVEAIKVDVFVYK